MYKGGNFISLPDPVQEIWSEPALMPGSTPYPQQTSKGLPWDQLLETIQR